MNKKDIVSGIKNHIDHLQKQYDWIEKKVKESPNTKRAEYFKAWGRSVWVTMHELRKLIK